ncbi:hypothetical protein [Collimonas humicola]|uniref:hypothetical protein n=1 Tax=Collimonas humicola TaxID=2825886 RepID=UPI001B8B30A4|nr:hypothetical protein [Collimonas humicola]
MHERSEKWRGNAEIIIKMKSFITIICYCNLLIYKDTNENMMLHAKALPGARQGKLLNFQGEIIGVGTTRARTGRTAAINWRQIRTDTERHLAGRPDLSA